MKKVSSVLEEHGLQFRWRAKSKRRRQLPPPPPTPPAEPAPLLRPLTYDQGVRLRPGLSVVGYLRSEIGLGQAVRCLAYAVDSARLPCSFHHLPLPGRENEAEFSTKCIALPDRRASLVVINLAAAGSLYEEVRGGRLNILYPFWELARINFLQIPEIERYAEVWAPTRFIAEMFETYSTRPVELVRQPLMIRPLEPPPASGAPLTFLTFFDYDSFGERKNPQATVLAFRQAFSAQGDDVRLVVKTRGGDDRGLRAWLAEQVTADKRIVVIDRTIDRQAMEKLVDDCHVFVSLHRSEGFGFGAAEALAAGKVVIATDYSGTTDFVTPETGYPIRYKLIPVPKGAYLSEEQQVWADPDLDHAAQVMWSIYDDYASAQAKGKAGRDLMVAQHSPQVIGAQIRQMLLDRNVI